VGVGGVGAAERGEEGDAQSGGDEGLLDGELAGPVGGRRSLPFGVGPPRQKACLRRQGVAASLGWPTTLSTAPLGSLTKKRRTPHGSSVSGWTSARPRRSASA
jgi:hypothetical protein